MRQMNIPVRSVRLFTDDGVDISELGEKVVKFMMANDNSFCCSDKDKEKIRLHRDTLEALHKRFMCEKNVKCSYQSFARHVPDLIKKPKPEDWGTSPFHTCVYPELKLEGLKATQVDSSGVTLEWLLQLPSTDYPVLRKRLTGCGKLITYKKLATERNTMNATSKENDKVTVSKKSYQTVQ